MPDISTLIFDIDGNPIKQKEKSIMKFTLQWLKAATFRAIRTAGQTVVAIIGTNVVGITAIDWPYILAVTATATVLSYATSLASLPEAKLPEPDFKVGGTD